MTYTEMADARRQRRAAVKHGTPFRAAILMAREVAAARELPIAQQQAVLAAIGPYESRGKGRGGISTPGIASPWISGPQ